MSEESSYEPLAEVYLSLNNVPSSEIVYCLCSRVVLSCLDAQELEVQEIHPIEEFLVQPPTKPPVRASIESVESLTLLPVQVFKRKENEEVVSCYCSASHCSTDEHDSVREAEAALHSDSGADLSESSKDLDWDRHWAKHGERVVWESWIKKYGEYIDPSYYNRTVEDFSEDAQFNITAESESGRKSFTGLLLDSINEEGEKTGISPEDVLEPMPQDFDNFSEISETSGTGDDYFRLRSCSRSSRSSLQTDSLTNVTPITIYSSELSAEESSAHSTSNSFISSSDSISSNEVQWQQLWIEHFNEQYKACYEAFISRFETSPPDESYPTVFEDNPLTADIDLLTESGFEPVDDPSSKEEVTVIVVGCDQEENKENISKNSTRVPYKAGKHREPRASKTHSVGYLLNSLRSLSVAQDSVLGETDEESQFKIESKMKTESPQLIEDVDVSLQGSISSEPPSLDHSHSDGDLTTFSPRESVTSPPSHQHQDTTTSYDESEAKSSDVCTVINCDSSDEGLRVVKNLKRVHVSHDSSLEKMKGAFSLMGFVFNEAKNVEKAHVVYRKRNIRYHNRMLKLPRPNNHIRFDDDGNPTILDKVKYFMQEQTNSGPPRKPSVELETPQVEIDDFSEKDDETTEEEEENIMSAEEWGANLSSAERKERPTKRRKRKVRRKKQSSVTLPIEIQQNERLKKYWYQRYRLFSKFDKGIRLDEESWYSVTPEEVSKHLAERCRCDLIVDACCGAGGNTIQFAFTCERVIAIDIDPKKIELARHNAEVYGVADRIEFIIGDFLQLAPMLQAEVVFLSPPWGGPTYLANPCYSLESIVVPGGGEALYDAAKAISPHIAYFLPKNIDTSELVKMVGPGGSVEVEQNFLDKKLVAVTAYFGELVDSA